MQAVLQDGGVAGAGSVSEKEVRFYVELAEQGIQAQLVPVRGLYESLPPRFVQPPYGTVVMGAYDKIVLQKAGVTGNRIVFQEFTDSEGPF